MNKLNVFLLSCVFLASSPGAMADFSAVAPDGRRVLLKDDGTWKYEVAGDGKGASANEQRAPQAVLQLEKMFQLGPQCRFELRLLNALPYEIVQLVPYFSAYRANGVMHQSLGVGFQNVRPADSRKRDVDFVGISCSDIVRVQVVGGDRCEMGELSKFSLVNGECLARLQVTPSELVKLEK